MAISAYTHRALLLAAVARLQDRLGMDDDECGVEGDGQPPASSGERYVAVHPLDIALGTPETEAWMAEPAVGVTISVKAGRAPADRHGTDVIASTTGLAVLAESCAKYLHDSQTVRASANAALEVGSQPFTETLRLVGGIPAPQRCTPDWFGAKADGRGSAAAGWRIALRFMARRPEALPDASED